MTRERSAAGLHGRRDGVIAEVLDHRGGRRVSAYLPAHPPQLLVVAGDGQLVGQWAQRAHAVGTPPAVVVAVDRAGSEDDRLREYVPGLDPQVFAAHEHFVVHEVSAWVRRRCGVRLPPERTVVAGVSAGAELAVALGLRHPEVYGVVYGASPGGGYHPPVVLPEQLPRVYLTAGTGEPWFGENAARWARALQGAGADVVLTEREGGHGGSFWQEEFTTMLTWAAPAKGSEAAQDRSV